MCLRISEQGKAAIFLASLSYADIYLDVHFSYTQMGFIGSSWQSFPRISKLEASIKTSHQDAFQKSWELQPSYKDRKGIKLLPCERSRKWYCTRKQEAHTRWVTFHLLPDPLHSLRKEIPANFRGKFGIYCVWLFSLHRALQLSNQLLVFPDSVLHWNSYFWAVKETFVYYWNMWLSCDVLSVET